MTRPPLQLAIFAAALVPMTLFVIVFPAPLFVVLVGLGWAAFLFEWFRVGRQRRARV